MEYGVVRSGSPRDRNREALDAFFQEVPAVPFGAVAELAYDSVRLATREFKRNALEKLIAAYAPALDVALVTNDLGDLTDYPV